MPVKDAESRVNDPGGGMNGHFARKPAGQPDVVVPQHHLDRVALLEQAPKEIEQQRTEGRRRPDDRVLDVARDHEVTGAGPIEYRECALREPLR
jgi:hypothetical protein